MKINDYVFKYRIVSSPMSSWVPYVVCKDGFTMSVQAGIMNYSEPRQIIYEGEYKELEIGFPSQEESLIMDYCDSDEDPTDTVYGYVPVGIIDSVIEKHGGIDEDVVQSNLGNQFYE